MKIEELNNKLKKLEEDYSIIRKTLIREYCFSHNPYNVGDIIEDHIGFAKIETILFSSMDIECVYNCASLKKDKTPRKDGEKRKVFQSNIITL